MHPRPSPSAQQQATSLLQAQQRAAAAAMVGSSLPTHLSTSRDDTDGYEVSDSEMEDAIVLRDGRRFPSALKEKHVSMLQLLAIVYLCVVGGPYGLEDAILAGGLTWVIILLLVLPWTLNLPIGLLTSELACWAKGTKLLMYNGQSKAIEEITDGEKVMGPDGTPRIVANTLRCRGHTAKAPPPSMRMMDLRADCQSAGDPTVKKRFDQGHAARPTEDGLYVCCYEQCPYKTADADHIARHEARKSLHQVTEPTANAMYEVQYKGSKHAMPSWACTANHVLVLRWTQRPFAANSNKPNVSNYGVTRIGWKYGRVAEVTEFYATQAKRAAALKAAQAAWRPFEACITVAAFLACSTNVQRSAQMVKPARPLAFSLPRVEARLHTLIAQASCAPAAAASAELTATTAWVLGLYAMHGAGSVISIVNHAPREQNEALRAALLAWKQQMEEPLRADGVVAQSAVADTPASSITEAAPQKHVLNAALLGEAAFARPCFQFDFDGGECLRDLVTHYGLQSAGAVLPLPLLTESINIRRALLAGVIDGAAWWATDDARPNLHIVHQSAAMLRTVLHLARGLGCATRSAVRGRKGGESEVILSLEANLREIHPSLPVKQAPISEGVNDSTEPHCVGFKLQQIHHAEFFGFELSGDRKCLLDDFTVTHNSAMPQNGGYILWVARAFGNFWGFLEGWFSWTSSLFDTALYPFLVVAYLANFLSTFAGMPPMGYWSLYCARIALCLAVMALNLLNVQIEGTVSLIFASVCLLPFAALTVMGFPAIQWRELTHEFYPLSEVNVGLMLSVVLWVGSGWDAPGTVAGDVKTPKKSYPRAVTLAVALVMLTNLLPVMVGFSYEDRADAYLDGHAFWSQVAYRVGGTWLQLAVVLVGILANLNLLHVLLTSSSWSLYALALPGLLDVPVLTKLQKHFRTPWVCILINTAGLLLCCLLTFVQLVQVTMALNGLALILQCMSLVWLRISAPRMKRPYRIPLSTLGVGAFMFVPVALSLLLLVTIEHIPQLLVLWSAMAGVVLFLLARLMERVHQADTAAPPVPVDLQGVFEDVVEQVADSRDDDRLPDLGFRSSLLVEQLPETLTGDPTEHNDNYGDKDHNDPAANVDDDGSLVDGLDDECDDENPSERLERSDPVRPLLGHHHHGGGSGSEDKHPHYGTTDPAAPLPSVSE